MPFQVHTRSIFPLTATAASKPAISRKAVARLLPWAMKPINAGPANIPA
jgi:hypothetical protein